jgi:hypothetical protein
MKFHRRYGPVISTVILMSSATVVHSDWQYSKWGMSEEEFLAARPRDLWSTNSKSPTGILVEGSHKLPSGNTLLIKAHFRDKKLISINMDLPKNEIFGEVSGILYQTYGQPIFREEKTGMCQSAITLWRSVEANLFVRLSAFRCGSQPSIDTLSFQEAIKPGAGSL